TLYVGNLGRDGQLVVTENDLRNHFYQFGEIRQIHVLPNKFCAFIDFLTREGAELAAERSFNQTMINGQKLSIRWGRPQAQTRFEGVDEKKIYKDIPNLPGSLPVPSLDEAGPSKRPHVEVIT